MGFAAEAFVIASNLCQPDDLHTHILGRMVSQILSLSSLLYTVSSLYHFFSTLVSDPALISKSRCIFGLSDSANLKGFPDFFGLLPLMGLLFYLIFPSSISPKIFFRNCSIISHYSSNPQTCDLLNGSTARVTVQSNRTLNLPPVKQLI